MKSYLKVFGASKTRTIVLPILNCPTSSPLLSTRSLGISRSSKSLSFANFPSDNPFHLLVFKSSSTYTCTEPTFVAPEYEMD